MPTNNGKANTAGRTYAMLAKPVSDACNLDCAYCYYKGKNALLEVGVSRMSPAILEAYIRQSFAMHGHDAVVNFAWHGGEPLLAGMDFYGEVLRLQKIYGQGRPVLNTLQTNGTGITDDWCHFFKDADFLLGVSIDGPEDLHNAYRKNHSGKGSFADTMRGVSLLQKHHIPFNALTTVNRKNMQAPQAVYHFLRELTDYIQFLPVVESVVTCAEQGQHFSTPPGIHAASTAPAVTDFSVSPGGYGTFLCEIWKMWKQEDEGKKHIQLFDVTLAALQGIPSELCMHNPLCGHSGSIEANGDIYACDRYAFSAYKLGNIMHTPHGQIMEQNRIFGMHKTYGLPAECFDCPHITLCFGACPKDRLVGGKNYLCAGYKMFFDMLTQAVHRQH